MEISMQMSRPRDRGKKYKIYKEALSAIRRNQGTLIGIPDNALGDGAPNLLTAPEFAAGLTDAPTRAGLVTASGIPGYDGAIAIGHDGVQGTIAYKVYTTTTGITYTLSVIVKMDDGGAPTFGSSVAPDAANTFALVNHGDAMGLPNAYTVVAQTDGTYRVSCSAAATRVSSNVGLVKYNTNNNRTFKVTGYKLELGSVATAYTPQSVLRQRGTYQDSTGTMALSAVGEVLGLMTDRLGVLGPNLFTGTYRTGAATTATYNGAEATATFGGHISSTGANWLYTMATEVNAGTFVNIEFDAQWVSGSDLVAGAGWTVGRTITAAENGGVKRRYTVPVAAFHNGSTPASFGSTFAGAVWKITVISVQVLSGNHATQPTPANKPTLVRVPKRLGPSMATGPWVNNYSNVFDTFTSTASSACAATTTAAKSNVRVGVPISGVVVGKTQQIRFTPVFTGGTVASVWLADSGLSGLQNTNVTVISGVPVVVDVPYTAFGTPARVMIIFNATGASTFSITNFDIQEVLEWTNAINFNGTNNFLQTGIASGNSGWICAGVTPTQVTATATIANAGAGGSPTKGFWLYAETGNWIMQVGNGTVRQEPGRIAATPGVPAVVSGGFDASTVMLSVNGTTVTASRTGDATYSGWPILIGAYTGGTYPLGGPMTAFIHCQTLPTPEERDLIHKWMASTNRAPYWGELPTLSLDFVSDNYLVSNGEI